MSKKSIFIIDDDAAILESYKIVLEQEGYLVDIGTSADELESLLAKKTPNLILLDYSLPGEDGSNIARKYKSNAKFAKVPIIIISANSRYKSDAKLAGANEFIEKPIEIDFLLSRIKKFLS
jgi:DNA-binding response OmpR family regulator